MQAKSSDSTRMSEATCSTYKARELVVKPVVKRQPLQQAEELVMVKLARTCLHELIKSMLASFVRVYETQRRTCPQITDTIIIRRTARTQCIRCGQLLQMLHVAWSVCLSVCLSVLSTRGRCAKTAEKISRLGGLTHVGPRNHVLDGTQDQTNSFTTIAMTTFD